MALPAGYKQLAYIESTGTQYLVLSQTVQTVFQHVRIDAVPMQRYSGGLFGSYGDSNFIFYFETVAGTPVGARSRFGTGGADRTSYMNDAEVGQRVVLEKKQNPDNSDQVIILGDNSILYNGRYTVPTPIYTTSLHPYLFAVNNNGGAEGRGKWRVYDLVIYNNDNTEAVHLVPARRTSDREIGMYDTVNDLFLANAGTDSFITEGIPGPSSITVSPNITIGESVSVAWGASPAEGVTGYELQRSVNGGAFGQIYSGTGMFYTDTAEIGWENVQYRVRAVTAEEESGWVSSERLPVINPFTPTSLNLSEQYKAYLSSLGKPFKKIVRLEFLQPDDTVAFALGGAGQKFPIAGRDTRAFLQSGSVSVDLANGARRRASVVLANRDGAFDFAVGKLWFGQRVRISMGMILPNGEDLYFPMGVFYVENPSALTSPGERTITLSLTDKWAYLDGSLFGGLEAGYSVTTGTNIFSAIDSLIHLSKYTYSSTSIRSDMIDPAAATYTTYYNDKKYYGNKSDGAVASGSYINQTDTPYTITENRGSTIGAVILKLNEMLAGWIGYDAFGALRLEPSQDDIDDADKPVLFAFTPENSVLLSMTEAAQTSSVYNDVTIAGQGLTNAAVWARAVNADPASDTNINLIGRRIYVEEKADYWNTDQCASLARWMLKRKSILQKSITIECGQMFHLIENRLVSVKRTDKPGSPVEKHLIQGFTVPIGESGSMSVSCVSVNDIPDFTITTSVS